MHSIPRSVVSRLMLAGLCLALAVAPSLLGASALAQASIRQVKILGSKDAVEIEVEASDRVTPQTQVLTGPDRLVVDFPNAVPGAGMRNQSVDKGEVKDVRFGLYQAKPPVTRVVLDLKSAQSYQVFPGRTVIIKVMGGATAGADDSSSQPQTRPGLVVANYTTGAERVRIENATKPLEVTFRDGLLSIRANKATLSEVLYAVQQRTGAEVSIASGAEQERVVVDLGPAPAPEVLAQLLNGSRFNFLILSRASDSRQLDRVILSPRTVGAVMPLRPMAQTANAASGDDDEPLPTPPVQVQSQPNEAVAPPPGQAGAKGFQTIPRPMPEEKAPPDDGPSPDR